MPEIGQSDGRGAYFAPQVSVVKVSERFQERQQLIARPESLESGADRSDLCERLLFHGKIRVYVDIRGFDALVSQP